MYLDPKAESSVGLNNYTSSLPSLEAHKTIPLEINPAIFLCLKIIPQIN